MKTPVFILCVTAVLSHGVGASAQTPGKYFFKSAAAANYVEVIDGNPENKSEVQLSAKDGKANQIWEIVPSNVPGWYYIKSEMGRYLDVQWGSNANGTPVWIYNFNGGSAQRWKLTHVSNGRYTIQSRLGSYLTAKWDDAGIWMYSTFKTNGVEHPRQLWTLEGAGRGHLLTGFVDMHTHPMAHLGFGGKLVHGAPDINTLMPAIPSGNGCLHYAYPKSVAQALSSDRATHGGWGFDNTCGDEIRKAVIRATEEGLGAQIAHHEEGALPYPFLTRWPAHDDVTHQQMWIDWIRRAHDAGGLNVIVALAVNNATLASAVMGPGDINGDDVSSAIVQLDEMTKMVNRHADFMEIAKSPAEMRIINAKGKLAVILGVEIDNIGNLHQNPDVDPYDLSAAGRAAVTAALDNLWYRGVRYVFPIHLIDNTLGGTAVYTDAFNLSNRHQTGSWWDLGCSAPGSGISYKYVKGGFDFGMAAIKAVKLGVFDEAPDPVSCPSGSGHVNQKSLTPMGEFTLMEMMRRGMIIDVDHMSERAVNATLELAESLDYPVNSGHNAPRSFNKSENGRTEDQYRIIVKLGGMIGLGHSGSATKFVQNYRKVASISRSGGLFEALDPIGTDRIAIGTDGNVLNELPGPDPNAQIAAPSTYTFGARTWNYNTDGMAHYGMYPEFVRSFKAVKGAPMTASEMSALMTTGEFFARMWEKSERNRLNVVE